MPHLLCECGNLFEAPPGPAFCPACRKLHPLTAEKIKVQCICGAELKAPASLAGKNAKCPTCGELVRVPAIDYSERLEVSLMAAAPPPPPPPVTGVRRFLPLVFVLTLIPLVMSIFTKNDDFKDRLQKTFESNPDVLSRLKKNEIQSEDEIFAALPEGRIQGALLRKDSYAHWLFAGIAAAVLWGAILLLYPLGRATSTQLWKIGVFTGTIGILLLLGLQYVAEWTQGMIVTGRGILVIFFYILKFIGFSYRAALNPENGFLLSMLGFTFGVGLCEELFKALPLMWHFRRKATLDLRGAIAWGLASGVGFGISEGITYSSDFYNGYSTGGIYVVRFVSCVALHAVWTGATAALVYRRQQELRDVDTWWEWFGPVLKILAVSMVLHGLYDTLLKRDLEFWAIVTAAASFAWFYWFADRSLRLEESEPAPAAA
jgi:RsiW-degrading membrane proteinase PrsW (M82 family)